MSAEKQDIIRRELDKLLKAALGERARIHADAMEEALHRSPEDLRIFVRKAVDRHRRESTPCATRQRTSRTPSAGHISRNNGKHV